MSHNPTTNQKPTTGQPHISVNNGWMGTFKVPILCACIVGRHLRHNSRQINYIRVSRPRWIVGNHGWVVFVGYLLYFYVNYDTLHLPLVHFYMQRNFMYHGYAIPVSAEAHCTLAEVGVDFRKIYVGSCPSDVVRSWLRLQTPIDCIPHPCHMYLKCFSTLICCGWTCGCTLTLIRLWRWAWIFGKMGVLLRGYYWVWVVLYSHGWGFKAP